MRTLAKRPYRWLTATFTASAVLVTALPSAQAQTPPPAAANDNSFMTDTPAALSPRANPFRPALPDNVCLADITPQNVKKLTGFKDIEALRQASALITQMNGRNGTPVAVLAILEASDTTGVSFELMVAKAIIESRLGVHDKPLGVNGSARGVYQFMPATWLTVFSRWAGEYRDGSYAELAKAVEFDAKGVPYVKDAEKEKEILALRSDPYFAAFLKAMQMREEEGPQLRTLLGREPQPVDYYMVHFLGLPRAQLFYKKLEKSPGAIARVSFRREARYNHGVFYNSRNRARTYKQVYEHLGALMENYIALVRETAADGMKAGDCVNPLVRGQEPPPPVELIPIPTPRPTDEEMAAWRAAQAANDDSAADGAEEAAPETNQVIRNIPIPTPRPPMPG
jgi:hypothetical protein